MEFSKIEYPLNLKQLHELLSNYSKLLEQYDGLLVEHFSSSYIRLVSKTLTWLETVMSTYGKNIVLSTKPAYDMYHTEFEEKKILIDDFFNNLESIDIETKMYMKLEFLGAFTGEVRYLLMCILGLLINTQHSYLRQIPTKKALAFIEEKLYNFEVSNAQDPHLSEYERMYRKMEIENLSLLKSKIINDSKSPKNELTESLINAIVKLQGMQAYIADNEKARTQMLANFVDSYISKDESGFGLSESQKSMGETDIKIENVDGSIKSICEGFNLKSSLDKTKIESHVQKLFNYDQSGLQENYMLIFSELNDFSNKWKKYISIVAGVETGLQLYEMKDLTPEYDSLPANIKMATFKYLKEEKVITVKHIFIKMNNAT